MPTGNGVNTINQMSAPKISAIALNETKVAPFTRAYQNAIDSN